MADQKTVRCAGCGCLALRTRKGTPRTYDEADSLSRTRAEHLRVGAHEQAPFCAAMEMPINEEYDKARAARQGIPSADPTREAAEDFLSVVNANRACNKFFQWVPMFSPKEHVEMMHLDRLERIAEERKQADAERDERRRQEDKKRQDDRDDDQRRWQSRQTWYERIWKLVVGVAAFLAVLLFNKYFHPPAPAAQAPTVQAPAQLPMAD